MEPYFSQGKFGLCKERLVNITTFRDTGSYLSLLRSNLVKLPTSSEPRLDVLLEAYGGTIIKVPIIRIYVELPGYVGWINVGLSDKPFPIAGVDLLIGNEIDQLEIPREPLVLDNPCDVNYALEASEAGLDLFPLNVVTRAMAKNSNNLDIQQPLEMSDELGLNFLFSEAIQSRPTGDKVLPVPADLARKCNKEEFLIALKDDKSLTNKDKEEGYLLDEDGFLWKRNNDNDLSSKGNLLVVPSSLRNMVFELAHDNPLGGHLGSRKTEKKIRKYFFWPQMRTYIADKLRKCHVCQIIGKTAHNPASAPLLPIKCPEEPFERLVIDCVGPLPRTKRGNQYIFTIIDMATRYPDAIPMSKINSRNIVRALIRFFAQVGIPREIQSDQGSNFTSKVFKEAMSRLGVRQILSTAYHPQSQGVLERFHQTLKSTLRAYCEQYSREWDEGLPFLLFALREAEQESTKYSPFDLIFGHQVRGPLAILRDSWIGKRGPLHPSPLLWKEPLSKLKSLAAVNLSEAQAKMKKSYDQKAKSRSFSPNELVLVKNLIPGHSLKPRYLGPYEIVDKENEVNYLVREPGRRKKIKRYHIDNLKKYESSLLPTIITSIQPTSTEIRNDTVREVREFRLHNSEVLKELDHFLEVLPTSQKSQIKELITKYNSIFKDIPTPCTLGFHDIELLEDSPIKQSPYRVSPAKQELIQQEINTLLEYNLIEPSWTPWASPCLLVPKPDGTVRLCTDYRKVNSVTKPDGFPLPRIDDLIDAVAGANFVTRLDLLRGYYQVPLTPRAQEISGFVVKNGLFTYKVMPFGLCNAASSFQRIMNILVQPLEGVEAYLDDLVVFSDDWQSHLERLEQLLKALQKYNFTVNLQKCDFGKAQIKYLGFKIGKGLVAPDQLKVQAILNFPSPQDRKALQRFLGMATYYRRFCPNFAQVASPLTRLTSPKYKFNWDENCEQAFKRLKRFLSSAPVLRAPNFQIPFTLHVDASDAAIGAVLLQSFQNGNILHPICYFSYKLKEYQRSYSTIEKEALALVLSLEHFDVYLGYTPHVINIYSDHNPLTFINSMKSKNVRILRWALRIQPYRISIFHIKGSSNVLADALSRS